MARSWLNVFTLSWVLAALGVTPHLLDKTSTDHICLEPFRLNTTALANFEVYEYLDNSPNSTRTQCLYMSLFIGLHSTAEQDCVNMGSAQHGIHVQLLTAKSKAKNVYLKQSVFSLASFRNNVWLGLRWLPADRLWRWDDGDEATWTNNLEMPTCANRACASEICAFVGHDGQWGRHLCDNKANKLVYMCEWIVPPDWPAVPPAGTFPAGTTPLERGPTEDIVDGTVQLGTGVDIVKDNGQVPESEGSNSQLAMYLGLAASVGVLMLLSIVIIIFIMRRKRDKHENRQGKQRGEKGQDNNMNVTIAGASSGAQPYEMVPLTSLDIGASQANGELHIDHVYAEPSGSDGIPPGIPQVQYRPKVKVKPKIVHLGIIDENKPLNSHYISSHKSDLEGHAATDLPQLTTLSSEYEDIDKISEKIKCMENEHKALLGISDDDDANPYEEPQNIRRSAVGQYDLERNVPRVPSIKRQYSDYEEIDNMRTTSVIQQFNDDLLEVFEEEHDAETENQDQSSRSQLKDGEDPNTEITIVENDWYSL